MDKMFTKIAVDAETGEEHIFEVYQQYVPDKEPYIIMLDGAFHNAFGGVPRVSREIHRTCEWFGWLLPEVG